MPIYLDRHDAPDHVTAEHVAEMHIADLACQDKYGCKGFTYWFDEKRHAGFCLIEAPNREAIERMHNEAHGDVPAQIIEVEEHFVESFLGRLADPAKQAEAEINVIDESAYRFFLLGNLVSHPYFKASLSEDRNAVKSFKDKLKIMSGDHQANKIILENDHFLFCFEEADDALDMALKVQEIASDLLQRDGNTFIELNMALHCGEPVTNKEGMFEECLDMARKLTQIADGKLIISRDFRAQADESKLPEEGLEYLRSEDERFLSRLMDFTKKYWKNADLSVETIGKELGYSKSQLYRKLTGLTGRSPNSFIKEYRLKKAAEILAKEEWTIAEIAFETGFNSPAYFSKCFVDQYGVLPSDWQRSLAV